jgi:hypothetical protein
MSRVLTVLIALAIVAAVLAAVKPWDSGRDVPHGPKAVLVSMMKNDGQVKGAAKNLFGCMADGIDRELTDSDVHILVRIPPSLIERLELGPDPVRATTTALPASAAEILGKVRVIKLDCKEELLDNGELIWHGPIGTLPIRQPQP